MDNLQQKIQEYFEKEEIKKNLNDLVNKFFIQEKQKQGFLNVFDLVRKGEFDIDDLAEYMSDWLSIEIEKAMDIDEELFDKVYGNIYDELQELYEEKRSDANDANKHANDTNDPNKEKSGTYQNLTEQYNNFTSSSVFQNILAAQEQKGSMSNIEPTKVKDEFYSAINAGDKIKVVVFLRLICEQGKLGENFKNDERFIEFFSAYLERHTDKKIKQEFLQNPSKPEYIIDFLQFILQKRLNFSEQESAMIGVGLAMLCSQAGEKEFSEMAYGEESTNSFVWA